MRASAVVRRWLDRLAGGAALLAVASCYGVVAVAGVFSLFGITLSLRESAWAEGVWAGIVALFALLALAGVLRGYRRHRALAPVLLALAGAGLIVGAMLAPYNWIAELAGFAALVAAAAWDWRLARPLRGAEERECRIPSVSSSS